MILFNDFKAHYDAVAATVEPAALRALRSGWYILGEEGRSFESEFAAWLGIEHAVGVASGTDALALALMACDIGPGDEVLTTNLTAYPTITAIQQIGARPRVVDIDGDTGLMDVTQLAARLTDRTRAIMPVHLYGQACDMEAVLRVADRHGLRVIEDCAQSVGGRCGGQLTGTFGDAACFSFYPTKNLGAFGDGGAVVTASAKLAERLQRLRNYGQSSRYQHLEPGLNSRLDEVQAAILRAKLPCLAGWTERRRQIAAYYRRQLRTVIVLRERTTGESACHLFPVKVDDRERFMTFMKEGGIQTLIHYPVPVARQPAFPGGVSDRFPVSDAFADRIVSLPIYPELSDADVERICSRVNEYPGR